MDAGKKQEKNAINYLSFILILAAGFCAAVNPLLSFAGGDVVQSSLMHWVCIVLIFVGFALVFDIFFRETRNFLSFHIVQFLGAFTSFQILFACLAYFDLLR